MKSSPQGGFRISKATFINLAMPNYAAIAKPSATRPSDVPDANPKL